MFPKVRFTLLFALLTLLAAALSLTGGAFAQQVGWIGKPYDGPLGKGTIYWVSEFDDVVAHVGAMRFAAKNFDLVSNSSMIDLSTGDIVPYDTTYGSAIGGEDGFTVFFYSDENTLKVLTPNGGVVATSFTVLASRNAVGGSPDLLRKHISASDGINPIPVVLLNECGEGLCAGEFPYGLPALTRLANGSASTMVLSEYGGYLTDADLKHGILTARIEQNGLPSYYGAVLNGLGGVVLTSTDYVPYFILESGYVGVKDVGCPDLQKEFCVALLDNSLQPTVAIDTPELAWPEVVYQFQNGDMWIYLHCSRVSCGYLYRYDAFSKTPELISTDLDTFFLDVEGIDEAPNGSRLLFGNKGMTAVVLALDPPTLENIYMPMVVR